MKVDVAITLRTELDTYAKQSFSIAFREVEDFDAAMRMLKVAIEDLPDEIQRINEHTIACIFDKKER